MAISIDLDLTPQMICGPSMIKTVEDYKCDLEQQKKLVKTAVPYIEVYNLTAQLRFAMYTSVGIMKARDIKETAIGLTEDDLIAAVELQGSMNMNRWYAINSAIRIALSEHFDVVKEMIENAF